LLAWGTTETAIEEDMVPLIYKSTEPAGFVLQVVIAQCVLACDALVYTCTLHVLCIFFKNCYKFERCWTFEVVIVVCGRFGLDSIAYD